MSASTLRQRWTNDTAACTAPPARKAEAFERICGSYSEPHRHYHTLAHLDAVFDLIDACGAEIKDTISVAFAVWYHDIIYDTARADNEALSAERADTELRGLGARDSAVAAATRMILATKNHTAEPAGVDDALFLDADFAILGAPPARYAAYVDEVRAEYGWLPDDAWRAGRLAFLAQASGADHLFHTAIFRQNFEGQARANIAWERARMERAS